MGLARGGALQRRTGKLAQAATANERQPMPLRAPWAPEQTQESKRKTQRQNQEEEETLPFS